MSDIASRPGSRTGAEQQVAAFFDMDKTLLRGSSARLYLRYLHGSHALTWRQWAGIAARVGLYVAGLTDFPRLMAHVTTQTSGAREAEAWRLSDAWFTAMLHGYIATGARERVKWHQNRGHHVAVVSAATPYAVQPVALALGLGTHYLATRLEVKSGMFTGKVLSPACFGRGKLEMALRYAAQHNLDLSRSYFYSDSHSDLPLLEAVGNPVAVNPNRKLARIAAARNWPRMRFY